MRRPARQRHLVVPGLVLALLTAGACVALNDFDRFRVGSCVGTCDDQNPCTEDGCVDGECRNMPIDGLPCGSNAFCAGRTCTCFDPYLDCDMLPGCEVDPMVDDEHCGRCDRACAEATCIMGSCQACRSDPDCPAEDGRTCTTTVSCLAGRCVYQLTPGTCLIGGQCVPAGRHPNVGGVDDPCRVCEPAQTTDDWSPATGVACDDGRFCTATDVCNAIGECDGMGNPCPDGRECNRELDVCGCTRDEDCGAPVPGAWSECVYPSSCSGAGERTRQVVTPRCRMNLCTEELEIEHDPSDCASADEATCCELSGYGSCLSCTRRCTGGTCTDTSLCAALVDCFPGAMCGGPGCVATSDCPMCCNGTCCPM